MTNTPTRRATSTYRTVEPVLAIPQPPPTRLGACAGMRWSCISMNGRDNSLAPGLTEESTLGAFPSEEAAGLSNYCASTSEHCLISLVPLRQRMFCFIFGLSGVHLVSLHLTFGTRIFFFFFDSVGINGRTALLPFLSFSFRSFSPPYPRPVVFTGPASLSLFRACLVASVAWHAFCGLYIHSHSHISLHGDEPSTASTVHRVSLQFLTSLLVFCDIEGHPKSAFSYLGPSHLCVTLFPVQRVG